MKRTLIVISLLCLFVTVPLAKEGGKKKVTCPTATQLKKGIIACPDTGCGNSLDPLLNQQKNTKEGDPDNAKDIEFSNLAAIPNKVAKYKGIGFPREPLENVPDTGGLGEGKMVRLVAWALEARPQNTRSKTKHGESCNCGFTGVDDPENTDVHIVLVDDEILKIKKKATKAKPATATKKAVPARTAIQNTLRAREAQSQTAEYAPRIRVSRNEPFDGAKLKKLIDPTHGGRLQVRVTGLIMYDSEHALGGNKLVRQSDWEIHPVFRLEFCPKGKDCAEGDWIDINK